MEQYFKAIIKEIGEDVTREGLAKTPHRAAKAFQTLTSGYQEDINKIVNEAIFQSDMDEMILVKNIEFYSMCEHHLLPFFGKCHIAYIPNGKIIGLSKISRIVDMFSRRLQVQEQLTKQIGETLLTITNALGTGVIMEGQHLCMMMRGVEKQNSVMKTSMMLGSFRSDPRTRSEFLELIK